MGYMNLNEYDCYLDGLLCHSLFSGTLCAPGFVKATLQEIVHRSKTLIKFPSVFSDVYYESPSLDAENSFSHFNEKDNLCNEFAKTFSELTKNGKLLSINRSLDKINTLEKMLAEFTTFDILSHPLFSTDPLYKICLHNIIVISKVSLSVRH